MSDWIVYRPDALLVWRDPRVRERLEWYYMVMKGRWPARFVIARSVEVSGADSLADLERMGLDELWRLHRRASGAHWDLIREVSRGARVGVERVEPSYLDVKIEIARRLVSPCRLCARRCMVDRRVRIGACRLDDGVYVHSAFLHLGEEAPLVPSGTIFYGGCNFTCVYCQNYDISQVYPRGGRRVSAEELAVIQDRLASRGARNINHVGGDPGPSLHVILESLRHVRRSIPQLWNSNMYLSGEALELILDIIDIWLPDFKYGNNKCAFRLSAVRDYWPVVPENIVRASRTAPMIIRHLVLPNHIECCTRRVLEYIADRIGDRVLVNIMGQYTPMHLVARTPHRWPDIARPPRREEIMEARRIASSLGLLWEPVS